MPKSANNLTLSLTETELHDILSVNASSPQQRQLQDQLREQTANGSRDITISDVQLGRLIHLMVSGPAAIQGVLKRSFQRPIVELISK